MKRWLAGVLILLIPGTALAYIDPNAGGILFQILTPVFILIIAFWAFLKQKAKSAWLRLRSAFRKSR